MYFSAVVIKRWATVQHWRWGPLRLPGYPSAAATIKSPANSHTVFPQCSIFRAFLWIGRKFCTFYQPVSYRVNMLLWNRQKNKICLELSAWADLKCQVMYLLILLLTLWRYWGLYNCNSWWWTCMSLDFSELLKDTVLKTDDMRLKRKKEIKWLEDLFLSNCDKKMDFFPVWCVLLFFELNPQNGNPNIT